MVRRIFKFLINGGTKVSRSGTSVEDAESHLQRELTGINSIERIGGAEIPKQLVEVKKAAERSNKNKTARSVAKTLHHECQM